MVHWGIFCNSFPPRQVSVVLEQFLRLLHLCGLPPDDVDLIHCDGPVMSQLLTSAEPKLTLFTGSSRVAEKIAGDLRGKVRLEDAGFDWKILASDSLSQYSLRYIAWVSDQDSFACSGQKCSAQSALFLHRHWAEAGLVDHLRQLAGRRRLEDLTVGPTLSVTTEEVTGHIQNLLEIPGSKLEFGGTEIQGHTIPKKYGAVVPTAVSLPLREILKEESTFRLATREIFAPFQIMVQWEDAELALVIEALERMEAHLTAAVVSNDAHLLQKVLGSTVNGTTYAGLRARTTGAPQNHWFGPAGDPRAAGIGSPESIKAVWSCHREIIFDSDAIPDGWETPSPT